MNGRERNQQAKETDSIKRCRHGRGETSSNIEGVSKTTVLERCPLWSHQIFQEDKPCLSWPYRTKFEIISIICCIAIIHSLKSYFFLSTWVLCFGMVLQREENSARIFPSIINTWVTWWLNWKHWGVMTISSFNACVDSCLCVYLEYACECVEWSLAQ